VSRGTESGERMTDGRDGGKNKSRAARSGGDEPKNVRKPERVVGWLRYRVELIRQCVP
jgi:hypothetical protein